VPKKINVSLLLLLLKLAAMLELPLPAQSKVALSDIQAAEI